MKRISSAQKTLAGALLALVVSCTLYWLVDGAINRKTQAYTEARDARARELFEKENMQRAQGLLDSTVDMRALLKEYLLPVDEPLEFLALVDDDIPRIAGAPTEVVSISKESGEEKKKDAPEIPPRVSVTLSAQGNWENLFHLFLLLEHIPYATSLDRATLTRSMPESEYAWQADLFLTGGAQ